LLYELGANEIEDRFYGKIGQLGGQASKTVGIPYGCGFNSLSRKIQGLWYKYQRNDAQDQP